jgi:alpha-tubulin suppressor-like RCC1 family protein
LFGEHSGATVVCTRYAVFSFGSGYDLQLGYNAVKQLTPRIVTRLLAEDVVAAASSGTSTLVCTAQGRAYWFGKLNDQQSAVPGLLGGLERVVGVAAGSDHLLAWTGSGELYTWGWGQFGQLGHGGTEDEAAPRLVEGLAGQQVVAADATNHSVACTASGRVYTFGHGRTRLGHGQDGAPFQPSVTRFQPTPRPVEALAGSTVVAVAAGTLTTAAVTEAGELYTWGSSRFGELGHGEENTRVFLPRLVAGLAGKRVAGLAAGTFHMLAWTDSGELYSWGYGRYGQLGHGSDQPEWSPRRVEALAGKVVVKAAAGFNHSVVATREQKVYTFGCGEGGQLAHGSEESQFIPKPVAGLEIIKTTWGKKEVVDHLRDSGVKPEAIAKLVEQGMDGAALLRLTEVGLVRAGFKLGPRVTIMRAVERLKPMPL